MKDLSALTGATIASARTVPNGWEPVGIEFTFTDGRTAVFAFHRGNTGDDGVSIDSITVTVK